MHHKGFWGQKRHQTQDSKDRKEREEMRVCLDWGPLKWAGVHWNGLGSFGMGWGQLERIGDQSEWIEVQCKSSEQRASLNPKMCVCYGCLQFYQN